MSDDRASGLILAGGRARRMAHAGADWACPAGGGVPVDKGLVHLAGEPLIAHAVLRLAPHVKQILISANRHSGAYAAYGAVLADDPALGAGEPLGPLAGVLAGLEFARVGWVVVVPCDTPFLPGDMAPRLLRAARVRGARVAVACVAGRRQPLCMVLQASLAPLLRAALVAGMRKAAAWQAEVGAIDVDFGDAVDAFANINTPGDLARAESRYASQWAKS